MSSGACVNSLPHWVEQLKLVERVKGSQAAAELQQLPVRRMPARTLSNNGLSSSQAILFYKIKFFYM
uniref:Uncharacterized protein n=1 Tax=Panthera leo TaxID=9689 RepID=A0A8C8X5J9_PANLE